MILPVPRTKARMVIGHSQYECFQRLEVYARVRVPYSSFRFPCTKRQLVKNIRPKVNPNMDSPNNFYASYWYQKYLDIFRRTIPLHMQHA